MMTCIIARYGQTGVVPPRTGSALATFSPYQVFNGRDGLMFIGASTQRFWERLCDALGLQHLVGDSRFTDMPSRVQNRAALTEIIEASLAKQSNVDVLAKLREGQIPCAPVLDVEGVVNDPHVAARGVLSEVHDPALGGVLQTRMPIGDGRPPQPAPMLGEHSEDVLRELGFDDKEIGNLVDSGTVHAPSTDTSTSG
ncbi:MAG: CoA transferase [Pseudomonadota bacterium]